MRATQRGLQGLGASLLASAAWALTPATMPKLQDANVRLTFASGEAQLSPQHKALIESMAAKLKPCEGWPQGTTAYVWYWIPAASLPRKDYALIGDRVDHLKAELATVHGITDRWITIVYSKDDGSYPGGGSPFPPGDLTDRVDIHLRSLCEKPK